MTALVFAIPLFFIFWFAFIFFGTILVTLFVFVRYLFEVTVACVIYLLSFPLIRWAAIGAMIYVGWRIA